jgi:Ni,Fe-hydrogenase maturation factor
MKILVFGNPLLKQDSLPLKILPKLKQKFPNIEFLEIDPTEDLDKQGENLIILDTVDKIKKITIINSIEKLHANKIYSMHDFDLALNLKLLKKLNIIKSVKIIGIPMKINEDEILKQISNYI